MIDVSFLRRTLRDYAWLWLATAVILFIFVNLFMYAIHATPIGQQGADFLKMPFVRRILTVMLGTDPLEMLSATGISAFAFTHPLVWTLLVVFCLTMTSGMIAGEMDRGTMDLLATLPISRTRLFNTTGIATICMLIPLCWVVWLGVKSGAVIAKAEGVRLDVLVRVTWHLCAVCVVIASFSSAVSAMCPRRGTAVAASFFLVFYAFVLNVLRALWSGLELLKWTDFLYYYPTMQVVRQEAYQWRDLGVLMLASAVWWAVGAVVFVRRDIPAR